MSDQCYYYGCWNEPGHYLWAPGGRKRGGLSYGAAATFDKCDGGYAPRVLKYTGKITCFAIIPRNATGWGSPSGECPEGQYLCCALPSGFTAVSWWDRNQGDERPGCNSTILLEGTHTADEVLVAGRLLFPHVFENLARAGIELVEVKIG